MRPCSISSSYIFETSNILLLLNRVNWNQLGSPSRKFEKLEIEFCLTGWDYYAEPSSVYDNNIYHEECLRCNACGVNLTGPSQKRARRFKNQIFCDLHFADVALMESSDFMQQLRSFKPQSLGCAVARRKSSTTLIFPLPPQACSGIYQNNFYSFIVILINGLVDAGLPSLIWFELKYIRSIFKSFETEERVQ